MAGPGKHRLSHAPRHVLRRLTTAAATGALTAGALTVSAPMAQAWDESVWERVADCESGGRWDINTGNGYYGGLQFYQPTWVGFGGQEYGSYAHRASKAEQIAIARRVLYQQGPGAWPVCSIEAGLTRANGGADPNATPGGGSDPDPDPGEVTRYISANTAANVRSGPGMGYGVVDTVARGTEVSGALVGGWLRIADGRFVGPAVLSSSPIGGGSDPDPDPGEVTRYISANTAANVRSGPGMGYGVVDTVARGTEVSGTLVGGWLRIADGRFVGPAVLSSSPIGGGSDPDPDPGEVTRYVSADYAANVRSGPGMGYRVVDTVDRGTEVSGTFESGWLRIGGERYIGPSVLSPTPV